MHFRRMKCSLYNHHVLAKQCGLSGLNYVSCNLETHGPCLLSVLLTAASPMLHFHPSRPPPPHAGHDSLGCRPASGASPFSPAPGAVAKALLSLRRSLQPAPAEGAMQLHLRIVTCPLIAQSLCTCKCIVSLCSVILQPRSAGGSISAKGPGLSSGAGCVSDI